MDVAALSLRVCIDVDDLECGVSFYTQAFGLRIGRRLGVHWVELIGGPVPFDLLGTKPGSKASVTTEAERDFARHWTPVHLDFVVPSLEPALERALAAGAKLERPVRTEVYGKLANLADPFGHGICLIEMNERGYDALSPSSTS